MAGKFRDLRQEIENECWEFSENRKMPNDERQLLNAVKKRNWIKVEKILSRGVSVNITDAEGTPLLHLLANGVLSEDTISTMTTLLYFGANPDECDRFGQTAIHLAVNNSSKLVRALLEAGSSPNKQDHAGVTALMKACASESADALVTVTLLLDHHGNAQLKDQAGMTALHYLCSNIKQDLHVRNEIALKLLMSGLSSTTTDHSGKIPLCYELERFVQSPHTIVFKYADFLLVRTLIQAGSRLNLRNKKHERWIQYVASYSSMDLLRQLLEISKTVLPLDVLKKLPKLTEVAIDPTGAFHQHIKNLCRSPHTLQELSRIVIREILKGKVLYCTPFLPLPQKIQSYVSLQV